jgi:hypothetical protein
LSKGTLIFSNQYAVSATTTNVLNGNNGVILIDGGTISAVTGTNAIGVRIGVNAGVPGSLMTITNGGKMLSELGTIGASSSFNTGIVTGVGSVWSNASTLAVGSDIAGGFDCLKVLNGASVINNGLLKVRSTNSLVFTAGTISTGATDIDPGANNSNEFVVGDGTSAAYYDMAGGTNYQTFGSPGLVVTNNASLRGNGTITGTTTVLGNFVPGFAGSVGTIFTSNSLSFGSSAVLNYDLGTSSDSVTVNGNLALNNATINVTDAGGFTATTYTLFTYGGTVSGTLNVGTLPAGYTATVSTATAPFVQLIVSVAASDPYTTWASSYGLTGGNALGTADPDADGMNNTNEFLAGFAPNNNAAYLHITAVTRSGTNVVVSYLGANGDSTYNGGPASRTNVLEFTTGTANGSYSNNFTSTGQTNILSGGTGLGTVTSFIATNGASGATKYYRVRVLVP